MNLWERDNYTAQISVLYNVYIYEYDISKANINILYSKGIIDKQTYDYLYNAERMKRQIYIGNLQKDSKIAQALKEGFIEYRHKLFMSNNIQDYEVLSIKKDAIYVISRRLQNTNFGLVNFIEKNWYSGFYKIKNLELYYKYFFSFYILFNISSFFILYSSWVISPASNNCLSLPSTCIGSSLL